MSAGFGRTLALVADALIDGRGSPPVPNPTVLVSGDRIVDVLLDGASPPEEAEVVRMPGTTILPGLIDAHLHVAGLAVNAMFPTDDPLAFTDAFMRRLVAHGITSVRDTGSPDIGSTFSLMKRGRDGWPRFFGSGFNLDGQPGGPWLGLRSLSGPAEAARAVHELVDGGADFIKAYVWATPDLLDAVVAAARGRGVRVAAHVGYRVTAEEAVRRGVSALEHVRVGPELVPDERRAEFEALPERRSDALVSFAAWRYADPAGERAGEVIRLFADRGTFITPTLCLSESVLRPEARAGLRGEWALPPAGERVWAEGAYDADFSAEDRQWTSVELARQMAFLGRAHEAGVRIAAGTDTPNPFISPGNSLHRELELLVACGLPPLEAIRAATSTAAELIGNPSIGVVEPGRLADLTIVRGDPSVNISATRGIEAVMIGGRFVDLVARQS